jgi:hypothetical protein
MVPAEFDGLKGKRVAVVCLDVNSLSGVGGEADTIARAVGMLLSRNVKDMKLVRHTDVADWVDTHGDDLTDFRDVGRGVKADMVVGIDLLAFNLHEGQTLLKGRSKVGVKVYDMTKGGELVYEASPRGERSQFSQRLHWNPGGAHRPRLLRRRVGRRLWLRRPASGELTTSSR